MISEPDPVGKVVETYRKMQSEISKDASEYDVRHRIIKYLVEGLLGYQGKDYQAEKDKTDIKLLDETHSLVLVVIETKKPTVYVDDEKWKKQAFGYADAFTKYVVLTNGLQLRIWNRIKKAKPFINLDFEAILSEKRLVSEKLTMAEKSQISSLWELQGEPLE